MTFYSSLGTLGILVTLDTSYFSPVHFSKIFLISCLPLIKLGNKGNLPFKKSLTPGIREPVIKSLLLST